MSHGNADLAPLDLGLASEVDPFAIQPGVILFDRFCVIGRVRHSAHSWRVQVTDLQRALGAAPHHRLELHVLPLSEDWERAFWAALPAHQQGQRRVEGLLSLPCGIGMLTVHTEGPGLRLPLKRQDALTVARTLGRILVRVHAVGVAGVRFDLRDIRLDVFGALQFATWHHVTRLRFSDPQQLDQQADVQSLIEILHTLGDEPISAALRDVERRASAVLDRMIAIRDGTNPLSANDALPAIAPFVGRELPLLRIQEAGARCRHSGVEAFLVTGEPEIGRSRLLDQLSTDFRRGDALWVLSAGFRQPSPHSGIAVLLDGVVALLQHAGIREREQLVARIRQRVGANVALFNAACPALAELVGRYTVTAPLTLDELSTRIATTMADLLSAIASPDRPLALLLDDIDQADASIRAVVYQLTIPTRTDPLLLVLSQRPDLPGSASLRSGIPRPVAEIALGPLSLASVRTLIHTSLPGPVVADTQLAFLLFDASGGRPAATWSRLQGWVDRGILAKDLAGEWRLTDHHDLCNVVALPSSWDDLGANARLIAALAQVRPEPVTPGWLARVTGWNAAKVREAAAELAASSILILDPGGRLTFPDARARDRAAASSTEADVASAHGMVARWLSQLGNASVVQRAWHEEHAAPAGVSEDLARLHLEAGSTHLTQCDAVRALWHFDCALARTTDPSTLGAAREGRADALLLQDRNKEALAAYLQVFEQTTEPLAALGIANRVVHAFYLFGDEQACLAVADRALQSVGQRLPEHMLHAIRDVVAAMARLWLPRASYEPAIADSLAVLHCRLLASLATSHPHVGVSSLFRGLAAAHGYRTAAGAWARAFFSVVVASMGMTTRMRRLLDSAEDDARAEDDAMSLGVVLHLRGQNELTLGHYELGQAALASAVQEFRRAGDLSISVLSQAIATEFAMGREPIGALAVRIQDATASAWRHRYRSILPLLDGMRMLLQARQGKLSPGEESAIEANPDLVTDAFAVSGRAYTALALLHVGALQPALSVARNAYEGYRRSSGPLPFLSVAVIAYAEALVAAADDLQEARRIIRLLVRISRSVHSVRVASRLVSAKLALREGNLRRAKRILIDLVESASVHQEGWHVLQAHQLLSRILAGRDATQANAHAALARRWSVHLGCVEPAPEVPEVEPAGSRVEPQRRDEDVPLWLLLDQLRNTFGQVLPPSVSLKIRSTAGVRVIGSRERLELLIVHLILAVRDTLEAPTTVTITVDEVELVAEEAARILQARAGRWGTIQVSAHPTSSSPGRGALAECRELCAACGGFFEVDTGEDGELVLSAYFPAPEGSPAAEGSRLAAVIHSDHRIRMALVEGIRRLGWSAVEIPAGEPLPDEVFAIFTEIDAIPLLGTFEGLVVPIVRRGDPSPTPCIRIPFLVNELEATLDDVSRGAPSPIAAGRRPE